MQLKTSYHKMVRLYINMKLVFFVHVGHVFVLACILLLCIYYYVSILYVFYKAAHVANKVVYNNDHINLITGNWES